jgi:hypothetical protein
MSNQVSNKSKSIIKGPTNVLKDSKHDSKKARRKSLFKTIDEQHVSSILTSLVQSYGTIVPEVITHAQVYYDSL